MILLQRAGTHLVIYCPNKSTRVFSAHFVLTHARPRNFPVGHSSQITQSQAHLTWSFFQDRLPNLVIMNTLLILLSLESEYHHLRSQDITLLNNTLSNAVVPPGQLVTSPPIDRPNKSAFGSTQLVPTACQTTSLNSNTSAKWFRYDPLVRLEYDQPLSCCILF
jgi:hypothetical protein